MVQIYPPSTVLLGVPFACLNWGPAHILWISTLAGAFILAAVLVWDLAAEYAPVFSALLLGFLIVNSPVFFTSGNPAGIAVSLCAIAVWCFLREKFLLAGVICLALSLALKPHDAGLVWLFFFLTKGEGRKRALQSLAITAAIGLAGVLWVSHIAPNWIQETRANLAENLHSGLDDPSLNSRDLHTASTIVDLQTVVSIVRDDPGIYNPVSYLVSGAILVLWVIPTLKTRRSPATPLFAIAPVVSLSMLPVYHRAYDAKLLMLAIPACAVLFAERGRSSRLAISVSVAAIVLTADIPLTLLLFLSDHVKLYTTGIVAVLQKIVLFRPAPLALLLMSIVSLWVYYRRCLGSSMAIEPRLRSGSFREG